MNIAANLWSLWLTALAWRRAREAGRMVFGQRQDGKLIAARMGYTRRNPMWHQQ